MCVLSCVQLFAILWTVATRLLCPWDSPGETWARRPRSRCQQVRCVVRAHFLAGRWLTLPMSSRGGDSDSSGPSSPYEAPTPFVRAPPLPPNHPQRPYLLIPPCGEFRLRHMNFGRTQIWPAISVDKGCLSHQRSQPPPR